MHKEFYITFKLYIMEDLITYLVGFLALGIVLKVCKIIREVIVTLPYALGFIVALKLTLQYVLKPVFKALAWLGKKAWKGIKMLCRYIDSHYRYRNTLYMLPMDNHEGRKVNMDFKNNRYYEERHYSFL